MLERLFYLLLGVGLAEALQRLRHHHRHHHRQYHLLGGSFVIIVKDDHPDVEYVAGFQVTDSEGIVVPDTEYTVAVVSDNPASVEVTPDPTDQLKGNAHFGVPGNAGVVCTVSKLDGTVFGSFGEQFTVTAGDPATITGGTITFGDLVPS